ncbi:MAG: hypothetical protein WBN09_06340 [Woeseiaceae bacterium]
MAEQQKKTATTLSREAIIAVGLLLFGLLLLPLAVFLVGKIVFGAYAGDGYIGFFSQLFAKLLDLDKAAWFLVLSPYLALQIARLALVGWRKTATM